MARRAIGPIGSAARVLVGVVLLAATISGRAGAGVQWLDVLLALVVAPLLLLSWQITRSRWTSTALNATGPNGFLLNALVAAALFSIGNTREPALIFYGVSMLVAAARGYAGCELLAISNWLLRRNDQVGCVVFSPLDAAERAAGGPTR